MQGDLSPTLIINTCYVVQYFHVAQSPFYHLFFFLAFPFPFFSCSSHPSIFCKMSALVRHRVSLFGKLSFLSSSLSQGFPSFLHCSSVFFRQSLLKQVYLVMSEHYVVIQTPLKQTCIYMCRNGCFSNC